MAGDDRIRAALSELVDQLNPGATVEEVEPLEADEEQAQEATAKAIGYGRPLRLHVREPDGRRRDLVLHTEAPSDFGHDRRADRAADMLLTYDTAPLIPRHAPVIDVGAIFADGHLRSLRGAGEFYLMSEYVPGEVYVRDLRRIAREGRITDRDLTRCESLARYLVALHGHVEGRPQVYTRAIRDLVGDGEGIYGIIDGYPPGVEAAPPERLRDIERRCADWRWRMRGREDRLASTHGDFHPFNILFDARDSLTVLDASRGCHGDPADDVTCLSINYLFMALEQPGSWRGALRELYRRFWRLYLDETGDLGLLAAAPPYLAWRALVLCSPAWYPHVHAEVRDALLGFVEAALDAGRLDPERADELFR